MDHDSVFLRQTHDGLKKAAVLWLLKFQFVHVVLPADPVPAPEGAGNILGPVDGNPEKPGFQVSFVYVFKGFYVLEYMTSIVENLTLLEVKLPSAIVDRLGMTKETYDEKVERSMRKKDDL